MDWEKFEKEINKLMENFRYEQWKINQKYNRKIDKNVKNLTKELIMSTQDSFNNKQVKIIGKVGNCHKELIDNEDNNIDFNEKDYKLFDKFENSDDDEFSYYFDDNLKEKFSGGKISFELINNELCTVTIYDIINKNITLNDLEELANYTQGQWSDGFGESFEQYPCYTDDKYEYFINPTYYNCKIDILITNKK